MKEVVEAIWYTSPTVLLLGLLVAVVTFIATTTLLKWIIYTVFHHRIKHTKW